jgi:hypothetical protein
MSDAARISSPITPEAHRDFHAALGRIDAAIRFDFRRLRWSADRREEAFAEARAAVWVAWHSLVRRGKDPREVGISAVVHFACRGVKNGRTAGANRSLGRGAGDLYHPRARRSTGLRVVGFDDLGGDGSRPWQDWLGADNRYGPAEEAAFRVDFAAWLEALPARKRRAVELLAEGLGTCEVAQRLGVTPAAVSQDRQWLARSWRGLQAQATSID